MWKNLKEYMLYRAIIIAYGFKICTIKSHDNRDFWSRWSVGKCALPPHTITAQL